MSIALNLFLLYVLLHALRHSSGTTSRLVKAEAAKTALDAECRRVEMNCILAEQLITHLRKDLCATQEQLVSAIVQMTSSSETITALREMNAKLNAMNASMSDALRIAHNTTDKLCYDAHLTGRINTVRMIREQAWTGTAQ
jgi:hypothetical protein